MRKFLLFVFAVYSASLLGSSLSLVKGVAVTKSKSVKMMFVTAKILINDPNEGEPFLFGYKLTHEHGLEDPPTDSKLGIRIADLEDNSAHVVYQGRAIKGTWVSKNKGNLTVEFKPSAVEDKFVVSIDVTNEGAEIFGRYLGDREIKITTTTKSEATGNYLEWVIEGKEIHKKDDAVAKTLANELFSFMMAGGI